MKYLLILTFVFIFLSVFYLFPQTEELSTDIWLQYNVNAKKSEIGWNFIFTDIKSKKETANFDFNPLIIDHKNITLNSENIYLITDHSGGESGGFYDINIIFKNNNKIEKTSIKEISGYADYEIKDVNNDKKNEIIVNSVICSGIKINMKDIKDEIELTPGYYTGIIGSYKEVYQYDRKTIKNVTFDKKYNSFISGMCLKTEEKLNTLKGMTLNNMDFDNGTRNIIEILQYYYYMTKSGKSDYAIKKITDSVINIAIDVNGNIITSALADIILYNKAKFK